MFASKKMEKTIFIFDMDDTMLKTPTLYDFVKINDGKIISNEEAINKFIDKLKLFFLSIFFKEICFKEVDKNICIFECGKNSLIGIEYIDYIQDLTSDKLKDAGIKNSTKKDILRSVENVDGKLVLKSFPGFYDYEKTIGNIINENVLLEYNKAQNKMIISGRNEKLRQNIVNVFNFLEIKLPNFGIYLYSSGSGISISDFKINTIEKSILENKWEEIHFFEDNYIWLNKAENYINEKYPKIKFIKHFIK